MLWPHPGLRWWGGGQTLNPSIRSAAAELGLDRRSLIRLASGLVVLLVITAVLGLLLREPLTQASRFFHERFGLAGMFMGILFTDSWIAPPLTHEPLLFFAHAGGAAFLTVFLLGGTASTLAGPIGYTAGLLLGRVGAVQRLLDKSDGLRPLMDRRGAAVVAAAAITPIPFALTTWLAGATRVPFAPFLLACTVRFLKVGFYFSLIVLGWSAL